MRFGLRGRKRIGTVVWLLGLVVALAWWSQRTTALEGRGMGFARTAAVAAVETGRIASLDVRLHDEVTADTPVAHLDDAALVEERRVAAADLLALEERLAADEADRSRRFAQGREGAALDRAKAAAALVEARGRRGALLKELDLERGLAAQGASAERRVYELEWQLGVLDSEIEALAARTSTATASAGSAAERLATLATANDWQVAAAVRRLERVDGRIARLVLTAGLDGQVTWIHHGAGDVVRAGDPILEVAETTAREVVGFLPTAVLGRAQVGAAASVVRSNGQVLAGRVLSVGADVRQLPVQLQRNPAAPEWGVPVRLSLLDDAVVLRDEAVVVRL